MIVKELHKMQKIIYTYSELFVLYYYHHYYSADEPA